MDEMSVSLRLRLMLDRMNEVYRAAPPSSRAARGLPRLVAVSKTKPKEMIVEAYEAGQRHFGENYVQELERKSNDPEILDRCPDIRWHFIGNCQTKNVNKLLRSRNLRCIETVASDKLADKLHSRLVDVGQKTVDVMVQVNTSGEENKNGVRPGEETVRMAAHVANKCPSLKLVGLMTIGAVGYSSATDDNDAAKGSNPDFSTLVECRRQVAEALKMKTDDLELSMGMSNDYAEAIRLGSTSLRVGSSIFGARS